MDTRRLVGLFLGPLLFLLVLLLPQPEGMNPAAQNVAAVTLLMATWWISEAIPIAATALLPIVFFPLLGVMSTAQTTSAYANHLIYLFLGGFLIAMAMQKWNLHRRIALHTIRIVGVSPSRTVLGFMLATAFLSMWISNTATAMMMLPIGLAVIASRDENESPDKAFAVALMLGIAYAASIGGVATLIGTPTNAVFAGVVEKTYGISISLAQWMLIGAPVAVCMLVLAWLLLTRVLYRSELDYLPGGRQAIQREIAQLGRITRPEIAVLSVFLLVAALWMLRGLVPVAGLQRVADSTIAIGGALLLFVIPADWKRREFLLDWQTALTIPWDILILFGGGFALAGGFAQSGLTDYLAGKLDILHGAGMVLIIACVAALVTFLTELTSNTATASIILPVMAALAEAMHVHPLGMMVAATIAASYAFMLPVATPPNAIVFGSRYVTIQQMMKTGIWLNLIGILLITATVTLLLPLVWGIDIRSLPAGFAPGH